MFVSTATAGEIADAVMELFDAVLGEQEATPECTGIAATWCPIHGDCTCRPHGDGMADHKDDPTCPLHAPSSPHGEPVGEQEATPPEPCAKCGYAGGCMEPWAAVSLDDPSDKVLIPCGTCPPCRASTPQGEPEPPTWQQAEDVYGFDAMREPLRAAAPDRCDECGGLNYWRAKAAEYAYIIEQESISMEELAESLGIGEQEATPPERGWVCAGWGWCPDYKRRAPGEDCAGCLPAAAPQGEPEPRYRWDGERMIRLAPQGEPEPRYRWDGERMIRLALQGEGNTDE